MQQARFLQWRDRSSAAMLGAPSRLLAARMADVGATRRACTGRRPARALPSKAGLSSPGASGPLLAALGRVLTHSPAATQPAAFVAARAHAHSPAKQQMGAPMRIGDGCSFNSFRTSAYKLHFLESPSGLKVGSWRV